MVASWPSPSAGTSSLFSIGASSLSSSEGASSTSALSSSTSWSGSLNQGRNGFRNHRDHPLIFRARNNQVTPINLLLKTPLRELDLIFRARNNQVTPINLLLKTPLRELDLIFRALNNQVTPINLLLKTPLRNFTCLRVILCAQTGRHDPSGLLFPTYIDEWIEHPITSRLSASGGHGTGLGSPLASTSKAHTSISTIEGLEADAELAPRPSATSPATAIAATKRNFFITILLHQGEAFVPHGCPRGSERTDLTLFSKSFETSVNNNRHANGSFQFPPTGMCATELISRWSTEAWVKAKKKGTNQRGR